MRALPFRGTVAAATSMLAAALCFPTARGAEAQSCVVSISGGGNHTLALANDGRVFVWGHGYHGQLGNGMSGLGAQSLVPIVVDGLTDVVGMCTGSAHSLVFGPDRALQSGERGESTAAYLNDEALRAARARTWRPLDARPLLAR